MTDDQQTTALEPAAPAQLATQTGTWLDRLTDGQRARLAALVPGDDSAREQAVVRAVQLMALGMRDAKLAQCEPFSVVTALASGLAAGLEPQFGQVSSRTADFLVIPRGTQAVVQMSVTGWVTLLGRAGWHVTAHAIYEADTFELDLSACHVRHAPAFVADRGEIIGAWARFTRGGDSHIEALTPHQLAQVRDSSDAWKRQGERSPWGQWPDRMAVKACIARGCRHLDLGPLRYAAGLGAEGESE